MPVKQSVVEPSLLVRRVVTVTVVAFTAMLIWAIVSLPTESPGLRQQVSNNIAESGVNNMVTAVLLNFRAYDTLLEIAVLFVAVLGLQAIRLGSTEPEQPVVEISPVLMEFIRLLVPVMLLLAGYLLWVGSDSPGGAFQSGAVIGAATILLQIAALIRSGSMAVGVEKCALLCGVTVFTLVGLACVYWGGTFLQYPDGQAKDLILVIETAGAIAIGVTLMLLFAGRSLAEASSSAEVDAEELL